LTDEELIELKQVLKEIEAALLKNEIFKPDRFNYWQMGNVFYHLHFHGIPRYKTEREFLGRVWKDRDHTKPVVWTYEEESEETVRALGEEMKKMLNGYQDMV
jgi:diadenosine tetraphosphate (Ap4A) HIT family hydrolase